MADGRLADLWPNLFSACSFRAARAWSSERARPFACLQVGRTRKHCQSLAMAAARPARRRRILVHGRRPISSFGFPLVVHYKTGNTRSHTHAYLWSATKPRVNRAQIMHLLQYFEQSSHIRVRVISCFTSRVAFWAKISMKRPSC